MSARIPANKLSYHQSYRRPARYTDKVILGTVGFIFMISLLARAPSAQIAHVPLVFVGIGSYFVAALMGGALRGFAKRRNAYGATRRASTQWTSTTRDCCLAAVVAANAAALGLGAWFVALTANAGYPALPTLACAAAAFAIFVMFPGYWEFEKLIAPRQTPGR